MSGRGGMPGWDPSAGKSPDRRTDYSLGGTGQSAGEYFAEKNRKVAAQKMGAVEVESDVLKGVVVHFGTDTLQKQQKEELVVRLGGEVLHARADLAGVLVVHIRLEAEDPDLGRGEGKQ